MLTEGTFLIPDEVKVPCPIAVLKKSCKGSQDYSIPQKFVVELMIAVKGEDFTSRWLAGVFIKVIDVAIE